MMKWLPFIGMVLNFVGAIMVACAFGKHPGGAYNNDSNGKKIYLASLLRPGWFKCGLSLIACGFLCQAIAELVTLAG
jgi:hypothetical protein